MRRINLKTKFRIFLPFRNSAGFTLIEALISMVILSVGIMGLSSSVNSVIRNQRQSNNVTQATLLTTSKLEDIKRAGTNEAAGGTFSFAYLLDDTANGYLNGYAAPDNRTRTSGDVVGIFTRNWQIQVFPTTAPGGENFSTAATQNAINMVNVTVTTTWVDAYGNNQTVSAGTVMHKRRFF